MAEKILSFDEFISNPQTRRAVVRYDSDTERMPAELWFDVDREAINATLKELVQMIVNCLRSAPDADGELQNLKRTALDLCQVDRTPPIKVALLGAQGAGKSLMINALFDRDSLSLTGADGGACTSSTTRYTLFPKNSSGTDMYHAEVLFHGPEKRHAILREHARNFYYYHNVDDDSDDRKSGGNFDNRIADDESDGEENLHQDESSDALKDTAQEIFTTLFGSTEAFQDVWSLKTHESGEFLKLCQMKSEETINNENVNDKRIKTEMAETQVGLLKKLKPFLASVKGRVCLWPLVDGINVQFYHRLLQEGVAVYDLPGWGDTNKARAQHAADIIKSVDVVIVLVDTIRVITDEEVIKRTRTAMDHHGVDNVKIVTTKTDALSDHELSKCDGEKFALVNKLLDDLDKQDAAMEDEEDDEDDDNRTVTNKRQDIDQYRIYLDRVRKRIKIADRAEDIDRQLAIKLKGRTPKDIPQIFHASASDYMNWTKGKKVQWAKQPALTVDMTSIPAIRQFLYALPAEQNLKDYERHLKVTVPAFIHKIRRTVREDRRDAGFGPMADDLDRVWKGFMSRLLSEAKSAFQAFSNTAFKDLQADVPKYKCQLSEKLTSQWLQYRGATFLRIVKCGGTIGKGVSKARGLEKGSNWNKEIARILETGLIRWEGTYKSCTAVMLPSLIKVVRPLHIKVYKMIDASSANLAVHEKIKKRWHPLKLRIQVKLEMLMEEVNKLVLLMFNSATMANEYERNLIAFMTDDLYQTVYDENPEEKQSVTAKKKKYASPKLAYKKKNMEKLFLDPNDHFIDRTLSHFKSEFDEALGKLLDVYFAEIDTLLTDFSNNLRGSKDVAYRETVEGQAVRAGLKELLAQLDEKAADLQKLLPQRPKSEKDDDVDPFDSFSEDDDEESLAAVIEKLAMAAKKRKAEPGLAGGSKSQRIKTEYF